MVKQTKEIQLPDFYFSFEVLLLRFTGIELIERNESFLYKVYSKIVLLFMTIFIVNEFIELKFHRDFDTICLVAWYVIDCSLTMAKVAVIYRNRKKIGALMMSFHEGCYKPDKNRGGEYEKQCIYKVLRQSRFQMNNYFGFIFTSVFAALTESLLSRLTEAPENWRLPFSPISSLDISRSPTFEIAYFYELLGGFLICIWLYVCDCAVISIIAQTVAQFKILEHRIRIYKSRAVQLQIEEIGKRKSFSTNLHDSIKHHLKLLDTVDQVEYLCSYLVLCAFLTDIVLLCIDMYYTSLLPIRSIETIQHIFFIALIAVQTFLYCWWGNEVTLANQALALGIFETYHPDDPLPYANALRLMLVKAQKPLFFTAGKFVPLSLETYKGIIKGSFSYFMMLRHVNAK